MKNNDPKYDEIKCQSTLKNGKICENGTYYKYNNTYLCGTHSLKYKNKREKLKEFTKEEKQNNIINKVNEMLKYDKISVNDNINKKGDIILNRMEGMFSKPLQINNHLTMKDVYLQ
jgi:hypothetical protein